MKHLADHRQAASPARLQQFLRLDRDRSESTWHGQWQKPQEQAEKNRRAVEFARIERGRTT